jgi:DNA-binding CsgD family transcriptional regulator
MATERLGILAGAAALREFTAPELAAYTGANPNTVRQVLQRERDLFRRTGGSRRSRSGRPAVLWRVKETDAIFEEIAEEESRVAKLQGSHGFREQHFMSADLIDRIEVYLTSAEEAVFRSYDVEDHREQGALARIALNLLHAANPQLNLEEDRDSAGDWWEQRQGLPRRSAGLTPLETVSQVRIGARLQSPEEAIAAAQEPDQEQVRRRAQRVAAFALISARRAEGLPIETKDLTQAAEAISEGSSVLPVHQTLSWVKLFVNASVESGNAPPVAVLTRAERSPRDLFPVVHSDWRQVSAPNELARAGYMLWVERWAETLLISSLIPGVVVSHDDSPESNEALTRVMSDPGNLTARRAMIVASTAEDPEVAKVKVANGGGVFYSVRNTVEGLLPTVSHAVVEAIGNTAADFVLSRLTSEVFHYRAALHRSAVSDDLVRAVNSISVRPSDVEITEKTFAVMKEALQAFLRPASEKKATYSHLAQVFDNLHVQWSNIGEPHETVAAVDAMLSSYHRILKIRSEYTLGTDLVALLDIERAASGRHEAHEAMTWAYGEQDRLELEAPASASIESLTVRERKIARLVADRQSNRQIANALAISPATAARHVTNIMAKLGFTSRAQLAVWTTRELLNKD